MKILYPFLACAVVSAGVYYWLGGSIGEEGASMESRAAPLQDKSAYAPAHDGDTGQSGSSRPAKEIMIQAEKEVTNDDISASEVNYVGDYIDPMSPEAHGEDTAAIQIGEYLDPKNPLAGASGSVEFITVGEYADPDVAAAPVQTDFSVEYIGEYRSLHTAATSSSNDEEPVYLGDYIEPGSP